MIINITIIVFKYSRGISITVLSNNTVNCDPVNGINVRPMTLSHNYHREIYQTRNDVTLDQVQKLLSDR